MVDISTFRRDAAAMAHGEWVSPGPKYGDFQIKARALGYEYMDTQAAALRAAARKYGDEQRIPSEVRAAINVDCMIRTALLDVRGLSEAGEPMSFDRFCELLRDPGYGELANVAFIVCGMVGRQRAAALEEAAGNFAEPLSAS